MATWTGSGLEAKVGIFDFKFDIPSKFRSRIWMRWSGGEELKGEKDADYFKSLQSQLPEEKSGSKLNWTYKDLHPKHDYFNNDKSPGREQLRQILYYTNVTQN